MLSCQSGSHTGRRRSGVPGACSLPVAQGFRVRAWGDTHQVCPGLRPAPPRLPRPRWPRSAPQASGLPPLRGKHLRLEQELASRLPRAADLPESPLEPPRPLLAPAAPRRPFGAGQRLRPRRVPGPAAEVALWPLELLAATPWWRSGLPAAWAPGRHPPAQRPPILFGPTRPF